MAEEKKWTCGAQQGVQLTDAELCYVVNKSFYNIKSNHEKQLTAVAIALAESNGWTGAVGDCELGFSLGLFQINYAAHPITIKSVRDPFNPYTNTELAATLYGNRPNFKDWSTYNDDTYKQFMDRARTAWPNKTKPNVSAPRNKDPLVAGATDGVNKVVGAVDDVWDAATATARAAESAVIAIGKAGGWLGNPHNWLRIAYVGLGAGVVLAGLSKLIGYDAGVLPTAAVAKMAKGGKAAASTARSAQVSRARSGVGSGEVLARGGHS